MKKLPLPCGQRASSASRASAGRWEERPGLRRGARTAIDGGERDHRNRLFCAGRCAVVHDDGEAGRSCVLLVHFSRAAAAPTDGNDAWVGGELPRQGRASAAGGQNRVPTVVFGGPVRAGKACRRLRRRGVTCPPGSCGAPVTGCCNRYGEKDLRNLGVTWPSVGARPGVAPRAGQGAVTGIGP